MYWPTKVSQKTKPMIWNNEIWLTKSWRSEKTCALAPGSLVPRHARRAPSHMCPAEWLPGTSLLLIAYPLATLHCIYRNTRLRTHNVFLMMSWLWYLFVALILKKTAGMDTEVTGFAINAGILLYLKVMRLLCPIITIKTVWNLIRIWRTFLIFSICL